MRLWGTESYVEPAETFPTLWRSSPYDASLKFFSYNVFLSGLQTQILYTFLSIHEPYIFSPTHPLTRFSKKCKSRSSSFRNSLRYPITVSLVCGVDSTVQLLFPPFFLFLSFRFVLLDLSQEWSQAGYICFTVPQFVERFYFSVVLGMASVEGGTR